MPKQLSPEELYIRFFHPDLQHLSDRTLKELVSECAKICKVISLEETIDIINNLDINFEVKQSLVARVQKGIPIIPGYFVEKIEKGSLELLVILAPSGLWSLHHVLKDIAKGLDKSEINTEIDNISLQIYNGISQYLSQRPKILIERVATELAGRKLGNRFRIRNTRIEADGRNSICTASIETTDIENPERFSKDYSNLGLSKEINDLIKEKRNRNKDLRKDIKKNKKGKGGGKGRRRK